MAIPTISTVSDASPLPARRGLAVPPAWPLFVAGLAVCLGYLASEIYTLGRLGFPLDDSFIHLQFAKNLFAGHGLSYNAGEFVTGSTAPLWTALLALLFALPGNVYLWAQVLGIVFYLAGIDATRRLGLELGLSPALASFAAVLTLLSGPLVWSALSGMEVPLFVLLSLWGMILHARERRDPARAPLSLGVLAVSVLARPEGALLLVLAVVDRLLVCRREEGTLRWTRPSLRRLGAGALLAVLALAGPLLFYRWAGGSFLPTTFAVKSGGRFRQWLPDLHYLHFVLYIFFRVQPWMVLAAGAGVLALVERLGTRRDRGLLPALWLLGLPLAYSLVTPPVGNGAIAGNFGRYYFPLFPPLVLLGVLGMARAASALAPGVRLGRGRLPRLPIAALFAALILWPTVSNLVEGAGRYVQNVGNVEDSDVKVADWLRGRLAPQALLAVNDIGAVKYLLPNRILDLVGIANPEIYQEVVKAAAHGVRWDEAIFASMSARRPDYVIIFPNWFPRLSIDPRFKPLLLLKVPDNITMGGSELVVYSTPWTRYPLRQPAGATPAPAPATGRPAAPPG